MAFAITSEFVELEPDIKLHAVRAGPRHPDAVDRPTLILLHFWGGSSSTWSPVMSVLADQYATLAFDFCGWGQSTVPGDKDAYSTIHLAEDVEAIIKHYSLRNVVIVGHSMGAKVAQAEAGQGNIAGLRGIVLVAPAPPTPLILPEDMRDQQLHAYDSAENAKFGARNVLSAGSLSDETVSAVVGDMLKGNQWATAAWPEYGMAEDIVEIAESIDVPVSLVVAEKDIVEPLARVEAEVGAHVRGSTMKVLPDSGHLVPLKVPEALGSHLVGFIKSLE